MNRLRLCGITVAAAAFVLLPAAWASAHPLGNFTRNVYAGVVVSEDRVRVDHVLDLAEIPAFQERQQIDANGDGTVSPAESAAYQARECVAVAAQVRVNVGGAAVRLTPDGGLLTFPPGAGGLSTLRLECRLSAPVPAGARDLTLDDDVYLGRLGWHEITAVGDGVTLVGADVPAVSVSHRLTSYPADLLSSPPQRSSVALRWTPGGARLPAQPDSSAASNGAGGSLPSVRLPAAVPAGVDAATRAFTELIGRRSPTAAFTLLALVLAVALGAMHALAPGHGKTLMAGYLVGVGGRVRDAVTIGAAVTITHTAGVLVLGLVLVASATVAPETVYPWMGLASGFLAMGIGGSLLRTAVRRRAASRAAARRSAVVTATIPPARVGALAGVGARSTAAPHDQHDHEHHDHDHQHGHDHEHHDHDDQHGHDQHGHDHQHDHDHQHEHDATEHSHRHGLFGRRHTHAAPHGPVTLWGLISLGFAGGLVPSPSALVVLLAGFAQHRAWFGLLLVVGYGIGMALALTTIGLILVRARRLLERLGGRGRAGRWVAVARLIPVGAALAVLGAGGYLVLASLQAV